jgi:hypothetical protein
VKLFCVLRVKASLELSGSYLARGIRPLDCDVLDFIRFNLELMMRASSLATLAVLAFLPIPITGSLKSVNAASLTNVSNTDPSGLVELAATIQLLGEIGSLISGESSTTVGVIAKAFNKPNCVDKAGDNGFIFSSEEVMCESMYVEDGATLNSKAEAEASALDTLFGSRARARAKAVGNAQAVAFARGGEKDIKLVSAPAVLAGSPPASNALLNISLEGIDLNVAEGAAGFLARVRIPELNVNWRASGRLSRDKEGTQAFNVHGGLSSSDFSVSEGSASLGSKMISIPIYIVPDRQFSLSTNARTNAAVAAPEPLSIMGSATALGFGIFLKRRLKSLKSSKEETIEVS